MADAANTNPRQLSDTDGTEHSVITDRLRAELQESALTDEQIDRLPYCDVTADQAHDLTGHRYAGWAVPCLDPDGRPYTTSKGKPFYRLKPAIAPTKDGKPARYLSPAREGCRPYFSALWPDWTRTLKGQDRDLVEGEKKADCGCAHGFPTIGLSGVDGWRDQRSGRSAALPELLSRGCLKGTVRIAWDSDIVHKPSVLASSSSLAEAIAIAGGTPLITLLPPELDGRKNGVDDFIARHGAAAYGLLRDYARPAGDVIYDEGKPTGLKWTWMPEPSGPEATHIKAVIAWTVLKDEVQLLPLGAYRWIGTHWQRQEKDKPHDYAQRLLHLWMDQIQWKKRTGAAFASVLSELKSRLESPGAVIWDAPHLMAFSNGTLDTRTNTFTPGHRRSDRLTRCLPYPYDPQAACPNWLAFLKEASGNDQHLITTLRAGMRWTIEPKQDRDYPIEYLFDLEGGKGRGKGTVLSGVVALCGGSRNIAAIKSTSFSNQNALLKMLNKAASIDFDASGFIKDSGTLNSIVSNEPVDVKAMFMNVTQARLNTVIWRAMNDRPGQASAGAEGADRRTIVIPFDVVPAKKDVDLKAKIASEAAGIFQWVWQMTMEEATYALRHAGDSGRIRDAQVEAALSRNLVLRWLHEAYFFQGCPEVEAKILFETFADWLEAGKEATQPQGKELTANKFGRELKKLVSTGLQQNPLTDASGVSFGKSRSTGPLNPGRTTYRIPQMSSWPVGVFLTGSDAGDAGPIPPMAAGGGPNHSGIAGILQNPSASNPSPPLNPEPSEPSEGIERNICIEIPCASPPPSSPPIETVRTKNLQILQTLQNPSSAVGLDLSLPEGFEQSFRNTPLTVPATTPAVPSEKPLAATPAADPEPSAPTPAKATAAIPPAPETDQHPAGMDRERMKPSQGTVGTVGTDQPIPTQQAPNTAGSTPKTGTAMPASTDTTQSTQPQQRSLDLELPTTGSGWDVGAGDDDGDDPAWGPRPTTNPGAAA